MIGLRGSDSCCNFYTTVYIYLLRKSLKNIIAKYSNVKIKYKIQLKKSHINNVAVYHIFFITLIYATICITFITMIYSILLKAR